jgi:LuxR family transcriptional regulator, maltose regulon positive regulatory protein
VWLELVEEDNDPVRFSQRFLKEFAGINPGFADLSDLTSLHGGGLGTPLLEALEAQMAELPEVIIVLDDLHRLSNPVLISDLGGLVDLLPPNLHLVLSTRVDLPIAWTRRRLNDQLTEIRQSDLAIDEMDSGVLLEHIAGRPLSGDSVAALVARTEGWAAGLQLAGMTLRLHDDVDEFITQFSGDDRLIADYLGEEVLQAQPDDRRELLLRISVLDSICAELVAHLTDEPNPQVVLEALEREPMFLVPLDTRRRWFRFHYLFRDMLRFKLRAEQPDAEARLLKLAASWHLERGDVNSALEYLLRARDWDGALDVIMARGSEVFEKGEMATVIRWITEVPESVRADRHDVSLLLAVLMGTEGMAVGAEDILGRLLINPGSSEGERVCAQTLLAALVQWRPRPEVSLDMGIRALEILERVGDFQVPSIMNLTHPASLETIAVLSCGRAHLQAGNLEQGREGLVRGLATQGATYPVWKVSALGSLGLLEAWCGNTQRAIALCDEALSTAKAVGLLAHPSIAEAYLTSTFAALERGEPGRASLSLHEGVLRAEANRRNQLSWFGHLASALLQEADGKRERAMETVLSARSDLGGPAPPIVADRLVALRGRLLRLGGSAERARHLLGNADPTTPAVAFEYAATALTLGDLDLARKLVNAFPRSSDPTNPLAMVEGLLLAAWLCEADGSSEGARKQLEEALAIAESHALLEVFVRAGPATLRMVSALPDTDSAFRRQILRRAHALASPALGNELVEPLTVREIEILSYLPSRLSNAELADHFSYRSIRSKPTWATFTRSSVWRIATLPSREPIRSEFSESTERWCPPGLLDLLRGQPRSKGPGAAAMGNFRAPASIPPTPTAAPVIIVRPRRWGSAMPPAAPMKMIGKIVPPRN